MFPPIQLPRVMLPANIIAITADIKFPGSKGFEYYKTFDRANAMAAEDSARSYVTTAAQFMVGKVSDRLTRGGLDDAGVGASNEAAHNIFYELIEQSGSISTVVFEGSYPGNLAIRQGRKQYTQKGDIAKHAPPAKAIVKWMLEKGITPRRPPRAKKWRMTKARKNKPSRPYKADLKTAAIIIARAIAKRGMTTHIPLHPRGHAGFQYYEEFFDRNKTVLKTMFTSVMQKQFIAPYFQFLSTGAYRPTTSPLKEFTTNYKAGRSGKR